MPISFNPEPDGSSDEPASEMGLTYPVRLLYRHVWLNCLFAFFLASNLCFPKTSDELDME